MDSKDDGVYILTSFINDGGKGKEYRIARLTDEHNIICPTETGVGPPLDPNDVGEYFDSSHVYSDKMEAEWAARKLASNIYTEFPPIYTVYVYTSYLTWRNGNEEK